MVPFLSFQQPSNETERALKTGRAGKHQRPATAPAPGVEKERGERDFGPLTIREGSRIAVVRTVAAFLLTNSTPDYHPTRGRPAPGAQSASPPGCRWSSDIDASMPPHAHTALVPSVQKAESFQVEVLGKRESATGAIKEVARSKKEGPGVSCEVSCALFVAA